MPFSARDINVHCWFPGRSRSILVRAICSALLFGGICVALSEAAFAQMPSESPPEGIADKSLDARVESILHRMTLEEKVGQLVQYSAGQPTGPGTGRTDYDDMIARGQIGSLFNVVDPHEINRYQKIAMEKSRLHIPILFGLDVIHGFKTEFPIPLGLASTWDPSIVEKASRVAAMEAAADGIRWTFSPMVDIARDARWGRMAEGAGEDPFSRFGDGGRLRKGLSGPTVRCAGQHRGVRQALCRLWRGRGRARLQQHRDFRTYPAPVLYATISRGGGSWDGIADERI